MARIRVIFEKVGWITFVNHMDLPTLFSRAARRAGLSQEFTQGFSPHPHISLASPLAIGVDGLAEPAEFWFNEWDAECVQRWNDKLPEGIRILKYAEVDGPALAKLATTAVYRFRGVGVTLDERALSVLEEEARRSGELMASSFEDGALLLTVGGIERCGAGNMVRALAENDLCRGWPDVSITREITGSWDAVHASVLSLI